MYYLIIIAICLAVLGAFRYKRIYEEEAEYIKKKSASRLAYFLKMQELEKKAEAAEKEIQRQENIRENLLFKQRISKLRMSRQTF